MLIAKLFRFVGVVAYASYLINVGLFLLMLPWSELWGLLMLRLPPALAFVLDSPAVRGAISAFGALHLALLLLELVRPAVGGPLGQDRQASDQP